MFLNIWRSRVFKVLLQPDNLVFNLSEGALHHVDGECVVIQIIQNCDCRQDSFRSDLGVAINRTR